MTYIFHVLGMPTTASTYEYVSCAFTQCIIHFCKMMKSLGHIVYHYGHKDSTVLCDYKIEIFNNEDLEEFWGENYVKKQTWKTTGFSYNGSDSGHKMFYSRARIEVLKNLKQGDFICTFDGFNSSSLYEFIKDNVIFKFFMIEPSIGYSGTFAPYKIFVSDALRIQCETRDYYRNHIINIKNKMDSIGRNNKEWKSQFNFNDYWHHSEKSDYRSTVIPCPIDKEDFSNVNINQNGDYLLFIARVSLCKGLHKVIYASQLLGKKLIIAGPGSWDQKSIGGSEITVQMAYSLIMKSEQKVEFDDLEHIYKLPDNITENVELLPLPDNVTFVGFADLEKRKELIANCAAVIAFPSYEEPFGKISIEAMFLGKPIITSARGGYNEVIEHGKTGFLCRTLRDMIRAINSIHTIEPELCIQTANKYTLESIAPRYQEYFDNIYTVDFLDGKNGWFTL